MDTEVGWEVCIEVGRIDESPLWHRISPFALFDKSFYTPLPLHTESRTLHCQCINEPHVFLLPPAYAQFTAYLLALPLFRVAFFGVDRTVRYYVLLFRPPPAASR
jgi:hypothetical protein